MSKLIITRSGAYVYIRYDHEHTYGGLSLMLPLDEWDQFVKDINDYDITKHKKDRRKELLTELTQLSEEVEGGYR